MIEAVIGTDSLLVGRTAGQSALQERLGVNLIAVSRGGERLTNGSARPCCARAT